MDKDLEDLRLSKDEWAVLKDFEMILLVNVCVSFEHYF